MSDRTPLPRGWGQDALSKFVDDAQHNTLAAFQRCAPEYLRLRDIDKAFRTLVEHLDHSPDWLASTFVPRSHSSYLGGARLALSGQIPEAFMVLRGCLECALYGFYVSHSKAARETWVRRHQDAEPMKAMKREFAMANIWNALESVAPDTKRIASNRYQWLIDHGAHPNIRGTIGEVTNREDGERTFAFEYLTGNTVVLQAGLKVSAQVGVCSLQIFGLVLSTRFELLGLVDQVTELTRGL